VAINHSCTFGDSLVGLFLATTAPETRPLAISRLSYENNCILVGKILSSAAQVEFN
jgi:hypothetical protein